MKTLFLVFNLITFITLCSDSPNTSTTSILADSTSHIRVDSIYNKQGKYSYSLYEYKLDYSDSLKFESPKWDLKVIHQKFDSQDTIYTYFLDPFLNEVTRVIIKKNKKYINHKNVNYDYPLNYGDLESVVNKNLIFRRYMGDDYGGLITKFIFIFENNSLVLKDSIHAGEYGEGWGATERIITSEGASLGGIIYPDDHSYWDYKNLLISKIDEKTQRALLINSSKGDTIVDFNTEIIDIRYLRYTHDKIIFYNLDSSRINSIQAFEHNGNCLWQSPANTFSNMYLNPDQNLMIASGYYFSGSPNHNSMFEFIAAYDLQYGEKVWDIPVDRAYYGTDKLVEFVFSPQIYGLNDNTYCILIGEHAGEHLDYRRQRMNNKLIIINKNGRINKTVDLSEEPNRYSFSKVNDQSFIIAGLKETFKFRLVTK